MPVLPLQALDDLLQAAGLVLILLAQAVPFHFNCGLHRLQAGA